MYVWMYVCVAVCTTVYVCMYVWMYVCVAVCTTVYVWMYVCVAVCTTVYVLLTESVHDTLKPSDSHIIAAAGNIQLLTNAFLQYALGSDE